MTTDDDLQDDGRPLGDEHLVAEILGAGLEVGDGAGAALAAVQSEFVIIGWTTLSVLEAVRQQQESAVEWDGLDLLAPELVGDADHGEAEGFLGLTHLTEEVLAEFLQGRTGEWAGAVDAHGEAGRLGANLVAQRTRVRHNF